MSNYPARLDTQLTLVVNTKTPVNDTLLNQYRSSILAIQTALGINPAGSSANVSERLNAFEALLNNTQGVKLAGDLGGSVATPITVGLQGRTLASTAPSVGQALVWDGLAWAPAFNINAPDATTLTKGNIQLSGDLSGTASSPTVNKINGTSVPSSPNAFQNLISTSGNASAWFTVEVSNITALKNISSPSTNIRVFVKGYFAASDGGDGTFYWDSSSTATDNGGTIIAPTGGGTGRWKRILGDQINVSWFGAVGTTVSSAHTFIQSAIDAASANNISIVKLNNATYNCSAQINISTNVHLIGDSPGTTLLNFSGAPAINFPDTSCLFSAGSLTEIQTLASSTAAYDKSITLTSAPAIIAGDVILIYNSTDFSFSQERSAYRDGEFARVLSVSGAVVTLFDKLNSTYTAGSNIHVFKLNPVIVSVKNMSIIGQGTDEFATIRIDLSDKCNLQNLQLSNTNYANINIARSYNLLIDSIKIHDMSAGVGLNYGIILANCQNVITSNCELFTSRHGLAHGGGDYSGAIPCRNILVSHSIIGNNGLGDVNGLDFHGNSENVHVDHCFLPNGIEFGGDRFRITNCVMYTGTSVGEAIHAGEMLGADIVIQGNVIYANGTINSSYGLINIGYPGQSSLTRSNEVIKVSNNRIVHGSFGGASIYIDALNFATSEIDVDISDNNISCEDTVTSTYINIKGTSGIGFRNINISNNHLRGVGISVDGSNAEAIHILGNTVIKSTYYGVLVQPNASFIRSAQLIKIHDNMIENARFSGIFAKGDSQSISIIDIKNNLAINCAQVSAGSAFVDSSIFIYQALIAIMQGNTIGDNQGTHTQANMWAALNITTLVENNNTNIGTVTSIDISGITTELKEYTDRGQLKDTFGTTFPVSGSWTAGDRVWNRTPTSGSNAGWICTTSGSPGTWKKFGLISTSTGTDISIDSITAATASIGSLSFSTSPNITSTPIQFSAGVVSPKINQNDIGTNSATGQTLTLKAQNATGTTSTGGALILDTGTGTNSPGNLFFLCWWVTKGRVYLFSIGCFSKYF